MNQTRSQESGDITQQIKAVQQLAAFNNEVSFEAGYILRGCEDHAARISVPESVFTSRVAAVLNAVSGRRASGIALPVPLRGATAIGPEGHGASVALVERPHGKLPASVKRLKAPALEWACQHRKGTGPRCMKMLTKQKVFLHYLRGHGVKVTSLGIARIAKHGLKVASKPQ